MPETHIDVLAQADEDDVSGGTRDEAEMVIDGTDWR